MIRNGYPRRLQADAERARLVERWQAFPGPIQSILATLLHTHGLQAAQLATEAVESVNQQQRWPNSGPAPHEKEERDDAAFTS